MGKAHSRALRGSARARSSAPSGARLDLRPRPRRRDGGRGVVTAGERPLPTGTTRSTDDRLEGARRAGRPAARLDLRARPRRRRRGRRPLRLGRGRHRLARAGRRRPRPALREHRAERAARLADDRRRARRQARALREAARARRRRVARDVARRGGCRRRPPVRLQLPLRAGDPPRARAGRERRCSATSSTSARATSSRGAGTRRPTSGASTAPRREPARSATSAPTSSTWRATWPARSRPSPRPCGRTSRAARSTTRSSPRSSSPTARSGRSRRRGSPVGRVNQNTFELNGSAGSIAYDLERFDELLVSDGGPYRIERVTGDWWPPGHGLGWGDTFTLEYAHLVRAIAGDGTVAPHAASFEDGYRAAEVCDAILRSSESGRKRKDRLPMKTSLGIWALGPMVTRFVPAGYQPQWARRDDAPTRSAVPSAGSAS